MSPEDFHALVSKWNPLPPLGHTFMHKAKRYTIIGVVQAGNKLRAECEEGKVYLFPAKGFTQKYGAVSL